MPSARPSTRATTVESTEDNETGGGEFIAVGTNRIRRGKAPAWPVRPGVSSFGDEGSDFVKVWRAKAFHADHTGYLRLLDNRTSVVFLRPQRFGKTLWLSIMECYYDVKYADPEGPINSTTECFSTLFGGLGNDHGPLAIARDETRNKALQNNFYVLKLVLPGDFDEENQKALFQKSINDQVIDFLISDKHGRVINAWNGMQSKLGLAKPIVDEDDYASTLRHVKSAVNEGLGKPLMVLVDEVDRAPM